MVSIITGVKGTSKTKKLVELVNEAVERSLGNVICVEQKPTLTFHVSSRARLIAANDYKIKGFAALYGFLSGICAGDHDITDIFMDATLRIGSRDYEELAVFLQAISDLSIAADKHFVFTISANPEDLPEHIFVICKEIEKS
ncbi:MAG: hypothetical protein FWH26_08725 [Oscillospiraceae bacterium]|nr:hypothetical protein [Oscillospiraceae bacterium]